MSATAVIALSAFELHAAKPKLSGVVVIVIACGVGLVAAMDGISRAYAEAFGPASHALDVEDEVKGLFLLLTEATEIPWRELGITVFGVRRSRRRALLVKIQERIYRLRIESDPRPTEILWTKKKGVLGQCWQRPREVARLDHPAHFAPAAACTSRKEWKKLPPGVKLGHTYNDYLQLIGFEYIEAHPAVNEDGKYRGCVVIQMPCTYKNMLQAADAQRICSRASATIARTLT